jgi:chemotaxis protein CheC
VPPLKKDTKMSDKIITEEQMDYLREMFNIGSGNVVTALSQLMMQTIDMEMPEVYLLDAPEIPPDIGVSTETMLGVRMEMLGDIRGYIFFLINAKDKIKLVRITEYAIFGQYPDADKVQIMKKSFSRKEWELSLLSEMGNIVSGVYLTALHDFCKLDICHTVPVHAVDMFQSLLDESLAKIGMKKGRILISVNRFVVEEEDIKTIFMLIPDKKGINVLLDSMGKAEQAIGNSEEGNRE